jgi:nitrate/nitrite-specific signal transduction histidine kinase
LPANTGISFVQQDNSHFVHIAGNLPGNFNFFRLNFYLNVTESVENVRHIQHTLLSFIVVFSIFAAFTLYFILSRIFKPLDIIASTSRKIANEHYSKRINIKGNNELSAVARDFNRMAEKIEKQIYMLEEEAAGKQRFIDNFAHEIRTPLTSIYGDAEYMQIAVLEEGENIQLTQSIMNKTKHIK